MDLLRISAMALSHTEAKENDEIFISLCLEYAKFVPSVTERDLRASLPYLRAIQHVIGE